MSWLATQAQPAIDQLGENEKKIAVAILYGFEAIVEGGVQLFSAELEQRINQVGDMLHGLLDRIAGSHLSVPPRRPFP